MTFKRIPRREARPPAVAFGAPVTRQGLSGQGSVPLGGPVTTYAAAPVQGTTSPGTGARGNGKGSGPVRPAPSPSVISVNGRVIFGR